MDIVNNSTDGYVEIRALKAGDVFQFRRVLGAYMVLDSKHTDAPSYAPSEPVFAVDLSTGTVNWYHPTYVKKLSATLTVCDA